MLKVVQALEDDEDGDDVAPEPVVQGQLSRKELRKHYAIYETADNNL